MNDKDVERGRQFDEAGVADVSCDRCSSETFTIRRVDEAAHDENSLMAFCGDCGTFAGKWAEWKERGSI